MRFADMLAGRIILRAKDTAFSAFFANYSSLFVKFLCEIPVRNSCT